MRRLKNWMSAVLALTMTAFAAAAATATVSGCAEEAPAMSAKTYVPEKVDLVDYYGGGGDVDGGGFTTFAHAGLLVPFEGTKVEMETQFKLLSKKTVEEGGDNVDGWVTYSFSASPAQAGNDKSYPYFGGGGNGYFLHITNYSGTTAPNCVEVQVVKSVEGATETIRTFFLDNALNEKLDFSLAKGTDGKYSLTFAKASDDSVLKSETGLELDAALFINERGQTFLSTAIYEGEGCDGNHWEHRGMAVFSMQAYTYDAASAEVTLSEDKYEFEEGKTYKPAVTVKVGTKTLAADEDYYVEYADNKAVGTGKAIVYFINEYAGNSSIEKAFVIEEKQAPADSSTSSGASSSESATSEKDSSGGGCGSSVAIGSVLLALAAGGAGALLIRRKRK